MVKYFLIKQGATQTHPYWKRLQGRSRISPAKHNFNKLLQIHHIDMTTISNCNQHRCCNPRNNSCIVTWQIWVVLNSPDILSFFGESRKKRGEITNLIWKPFSTLDKKKKRKGQKEILIFWSIVEEWTIFGAAWPIKHCTQFVCVKNQHGCITMSPYI